MGYHAKASTFLVFEICELVAICCEYGLQRYDIVQPNLTQIIVALELSWHSDRYSDSKLNNIRDYSVGLKAKPLESRNPKLLSFVFKIDRLF